MVHSFHGTVEIYDAHGTFENPYFPSYDILVTNEKYPEGCLFKHNTQWYVFDTEEEMNKWITGNISDDEAKERWPWMEDWSVPKGWRGIMVELCNQIDFLLRWKGEKIKVNDIKEKWGYLHFYYSVDDSELDSFIRQIVNKAEKWSERTCIECGKPAKYITLSWIRPYCEKCLPEGKEYKDIPTLNK